MLILASNSATRKALLTGAGVVFEARPAMINERAIEAQMASDDAGARDVAMSLAQHKASAVSANSPGALVIGADQTLALGNLLLHKPADAAGAASQLDQLKNKTHRLHAGLALVRDGELLWSHVDTAELTMRDFSARERDEVLALEGDRVLTSVGGYRLEGPSIRLFEKISGDYFTILGLPLLPLLSALRELAPEILSVDPT